MSLYYEVHGQGKPVILISGLNGLASFWRYQIDALAREYRVLVFDQRGMGASRQWVGEDVSVSTLASDLLSLMNHLDIASAHVVGHSLGGAIAQTLALDHPDRVQKLILSATWAKPDERFVRLFELRSDYLRKAGLQAYMRSNPLFLYPYWWIRQNPSVLALASVVDSGETDTELPFVALMLERMKAALAFNRLDELCCVSAETLVLSVEDDVVTPVSLAQEIADRIPGCRNRVFSQGGHFYPRVDAGLFNTVVMDFLAD